LWPLQKKFPSLPVRIGVDDTSHRPRCNRSLEVNLKNLRCNVHLSQMALVAIFCHSRYFELRGGPYRDLIEHLVHLAENACVEVADRFLANAEASFGVLSQQPLKSAPLTLRHSNLTGMRKWRVKEFDTFIIFYLPRPDGVSIVRVLHSAQDWWKLLRLES
jgi:toxin ParE1/3/4